MSKYRLLSYEVCPYHSLNSTGINYILTIEVWSWWGLSKKIVEHQVTFPYSVDADVFYKDKINVWQRKK